MDCQNCPITKQGSFWVTNSADWNKYQRRYILPLKKQHCIRQVNDSEKCEEYFAPMIRQQIPTGIFINRIKTYARSESLEKDTKLDLNFTAQYEESEDDTLKFLRGSWGKSKDNSTR